MTAFSSSFGFLRTIFSNGRKWWKIAAVFLALHLSLHLLIPHHPIVKPVPISHRGAAGISPENTLVSVQSAINLGAVFIEVDVQRTRDNVLVLLHDKRIDRTTNSSGTLSSLDWAEVEAANPDYPVPTLTALFELIKPTRTILVLELKHPGLYPGIEAEVLALIDEYELENQVIVVSFDLKSLERVAQINPDIETGQLYIQGFYMPRARTSSLVEVFWLMPLVDPTFVWRQHQANRRVWVWTVDNQLLMKLLLWLGVDGITTNYPQRWPVS